MTSIMPVPGSPAAPRQRRQQKPTTTANTIAPPTTTTSTTAPPTPPTPPTPTAPPTPTTNPATATAQNTFSQMQQQGLARPAPTAAPVPTQVNAYAPTTGSNAFTNQVQQAVTNNLQNPSRYDIGQVGQVRDALTNQLNTQFEGQRKKLEEDMARRGISASSIASGYYGDLAGQQANAMGSMNASLIQDAAQTNAQDMQAALGAGTNLQGQLMNQGLAGYGANLAATNQNNAANLATNQFNQGQYEFGQGNALTAAGQAGTLGVQQQQLSQNQNQFQQQLAQQLGIATMGDTTANRSIDVQGQTAQRDLLLKLMELFGAGGGSALTGGTTPGGTPTGATHPPSGPPPPPGPLPPNVTPPGNKPRGPQLLANAFAPQTQQQTTQQNPYPWLNQAY